MKWSQSHIFTSKEAPADAEIISHQLLIRAGYIKKLAPGIFTYGHLALRSLRKFEALIREELEKRGCTEILMPMVQPQALWEETGRWSKMGEGLLKFKNRNQHGFCLGATHEEAVIDYVRGELKSYRDLPRNLFQIQTKYRDEIRPRFGLMRGREFIMKDAYSFDLDREQALASYEQMYQAYQAIFSRLGLEFRIVQADAGQIGGSQTHEFQVLAEAGEDALLVGEESDFAANVEVCPAMDFGSENSSANEDLLSLEKFPTPGARTIADLAKLTGLEAKSLVKTLFFTPPEAQGPERLQKAFAVLYRGSDEANLVKIKNHLGLSDLPLMLSDGEVQSLSGALPGSCGPVGLKIPVYLDQGVEGRRNYIVGANDDDFHLKNVNHERDFKVHSVADLRLARAGDACPSGRGQLKAYRGIEVGHVFYLGTSYSEAMSLKYLDQAGKLQPVEMGCYGIGVSRTIQAAIEQSHDKDGIIWPRALAPFDVHLCLLDPGEPEILRFVEDLEKELGSLGLECLVDDRAERPGVKFKDADLLGLPLRVNIGKRGWDADALEVITRRDKKTIQCPRAELVKTLESCLDSMA